MTRKELITQINRKRSFLCVGLDSDPNKIPKHLLDFENPTLEFNKRIIDATKNYCVAYKPNIAFYESMGPKGWETLKATLDYIPKEIFTIADAKRGDIGNTANMYAKTFFETYNFDSVTIAPYMGEDSVTPFLSHPGKWGIVLGLTSNKGAYDFQFSELKTGELLYEKVLKTSSTWGNEDNLMFVVGATKAESLGNIRKLVPDHFLLVPGVGAQGGSLSEVCKYGLNSDCGLLINSSRGILYASNGINFAQASANAAKEIQQEMSEILRTS
ncbi:orotidine-5'-phosphate decarboxylase [Vicingaceae bacterium]|nr:orotidine-5'-phosphate decarboxylase [Vicingaceae bacterium]MDB9963625.1 orotidine-5'-phosphate decarboxylase [Vicingaceae bacterium]MDC1451304.1 orotidine-5'-phosphate decarboxylase [Vicingaceae bacterium]